MKKFIFYVTVYLSFNISMIDFYTINTLIN